MSKALDILEFLQEQEQPISLEAIYQHTHISKTTVYRILKTYVHRGYLAQSQQGLYRLIARPRKVRFGFGQMSGELAFSEAVVASLNDAAARAGVDLVVRDNRCDAAIAVKIADEFIKTRVDLVIEFQSDQRVAPIIADKFAGAEIPLIAVDFPHPHATFFGVDNYRVGFEAGELLGDHATNRWSGKVDAVLGLDIEESGLLVQSRITGAFQGVRSKLPYLPIETFVRVHGRGMRESHARSLAEFLNRHPKDRHILIAAGSDTMALGALDAVRQLGREKHVVIVGQDCIPEAMEEMQHLGSPWIGSVSHEVASYGPMLIKLGLSILRGQTVPPYNYVQHKLVTAEMARASGASSEELANSAAQLLAGPITSF